MCYSIHQALTLPRTLLRALHVLTHLILTTSLGDAFIIHVVQMRKQRYGELQRLPQGHEAPECQRWDSNLAVWLSESTLAACLALE